MSASRPHSPPALLGTIAFYFGNCANPKNGRRLMIACYKSWGTTIIGNQRPLLHRSLEIGRRTAQPSPNEQPRLHADTSDTSNPSQQIASESQLATANGSAVEAGAPDSRGLPEYLRILRAALDGLGLNVPKLASKMQGILKRSRQSRFRADRTTVYRIVKGTTSVHNRQRETP
jgi:hypothetical protein